MKTIKFIILAFVLALAAPASMAQTTVAMTCTLNGTKTLDTTTAAVDTSYFYGNASTMTHGSITGVFA